MTTTVSEKGVQKHKFESVFILYNYELLRKTKPRPQCVTSSVLCSYGGVDFTLSVYPNGCNPAGPPDQADLDVNLSKPAPFAVDVTISRASYPYPSHVILAGDTNCGWTCDNNYTGMQLSPEGHLTFNVTLTMLTEYTGSTNHFPKPVDTRNALSYDMSSLLESGDGSDVVIKHHQGERRVHKLILMARSPVFRAMFSVEMREASSNCVEMDVGPAELDAFLEFLYAGTVPPKDLAHLVVLLAKQYDIPSLVDQCSYLLGSNLTAANAAAVLTLADRLDLPIKRNVLKFITADAKTAHAVQETPEYDDLDKDLLKELMTCLLPPIPKRAREGELEFPADSVWTRLTVAQLKRACAERQLSTTGPKTTLISRLCQCEQG
eukprot:NODE_3207_length_1258_cov_61.953304_g3044_i0.p1 GENE.NODE_3207_length_1258_cov_61.953304_g3044_i0~~NODE_3207_length_1258_cov_61.953304_g3044_i0.p1  ORF type:complete len:398 (-),score=50.23 NODE_3207_length_1258_cov_61.953304_g3044_i0:64-1197(-)